mgnify:CR=1 FL=1|jgi:hypothetical protein
MGLFDLLFGREDLRAGLVPGPIVRAEPETH